MEQLLDGLAQPGAAAHVRLLDAAGELSRAIPELDEGRGFAQPDLHHFDVFNHNVAAVEALDRVLFGHDHDGFREALRFVDIDDCLARTIEGYSVLTLTRLACLVHDIAKPRTATVNDGRLRFPRHGQAGADVLRTRLPAAGLSTAATDLVCRLVRQHLRPAELIRNRPVSAPAVRRFVSSVDGHVLPLMLLNLSDGWATRGPAYTQENFRRHCAFAAYVLALCQSSE